MQSAFSELIFGVVMNIVSVSVTTSTRLTTLFGSSSLLLRTGDYSYSLLPLEAHVVLQNRRATASYLGISSVASNLTSSCYVDKVSSCFEGSIQVLAESCKIDARLYTIKSSHSCSGCFVQ